jgi:hypothetical protein
MKWIGGISFCSRVTGKVVIAVTAFILFQCLTIESSAQTASVAFRNVDLVVTPVVGTGWMVGEDMLNRYLIRRRVIG